MSNLLEGDLPLSAYTRLLAQYLPIYEALEAAATRHHDDPAAGAFARPALHRSAAIRQDLAELGSADAAEAHITAATQAYVERIDETCAAWPGGFVAHHYVRYLGDLSGGQIIRRVLRRRFGLDGDRGLSFYVFDQIDGAVEFKKEYRQLLDSAPWDAEEQTRIVAEARRAFEHNVAVFASLDALPEPAT